jgi:hypothetical protein
VPALAQAESRIVRLFDTRAALATLKQTRDRREEMARLTHDLLSAVMTLARTQAASMDEPLPLSDERVRRLVGRIAPRLAATEKPSPERLSDLSDTTSRGDPFVLDEAAD